MLYVVEVRETLSRSVLVEADSLDEGVQKINDSYHKGDIVLYAEDFVDSEINGISKASDKDVTRIGGTIYGL